MNRRDGRKQYWVYTVAAALMAGILAAGCATTPGAPAARDSKAKPEAAISQPEPNVKTLYAMARLLRAQGKLDEQEIVLRKIIAAEPKFVPAYADLAEIQMRQQLYDEATQELAQGLEVAPSNAVLLNDLGVCALLQKKHEEALQRFTQASEAAPRETRYKANTALALGLLGRYDESLNLYRQVMSASDAEHNLAVIKEMRGETGGEVQAAPVQENLPPEKLAPQEVAATPVPTPEDGAAQP